MKKLLLLHGALSTQRQFDSFLPLLQPQFDTHTLTFRGHGENHTALGSSFFDDYAQDILHYLNIHNIEKVSLFGYSMGGYAAIYFAVNYPERAERIMTLNTKFDWNPEQVGQETALLNADKIAEKVPAYAKSLMALHGNEHWKTVLRNTTSMMEQLAQQPLLTADKLATIKHPILIGVGDRDTTASVAENLATQQQLPNAGLLVLPHTPHPFDKVNHKALALHIGNFMV